MNFTTRRPSGHPSFPVILLAGVEAGGKTWAAVEATASEDVDRAFFIEVGESTADAYGAVPGADFEIIEHDGTLGQIRAAIQWAAEQPAKDGKYNLLIIDSMTEIWGLLSDNAQEEANRRARRKGGHVPDDGARITMDLWNSIKSSWAGILSQCRHFHGPVIMTARLELVTAMDDKGQPTKDKMWKIQAEKNLGFNVQVVLQARQPRVWTMTKIVTTKPELQLKSGKEMTFKDFSVTKLLDSMGIGADAAPTTYVDTHTDGAFNEEEQARRKAEAERKAFVAKNAQGLLDAEEAGDIDKVEKALSYYRAKQDRELSDMARSVLDRMRAAAPTMEQAQQTIAEVMDGEVVEEGAA